MKETQITNSSNSSDLHIGEGTVLLVDDESVIRDTGKVLLETMGFTVLLAIDGQNALDIFKKEKPHITLVITDMIMPKMNGKELFFQIRKIDPSCKVILASGYCTCVDIEDLFSAGLSDFIAKPYRFTELSRVISQMLTEENR